MRCQCELLDLPRSGVYRPKSATSADDLALMRRIDELHMELPFYGSRRMMFALNAEGCKVNRKRVQRLMRVMDNQMPMAVWRKGIERIEAEGAMDMTLRLDNARALTTCPQQEQKQQKKAA